MCCKPVFQEDPGSTHRDIFKADGLHGEEYSSFRWKESETESRASVGEHLNPPSRAEHNRVCRTFQIKARPQILVILQQ